MEGDRELRAMGIVAGALESLDEREVARVIRWAADRHGVASAQSAVADSIPVADATAPPGEDLAATFSRARPRTDSEKALVAAYWYQVVNGQKDFESQPINSALKNLGHRTSNITSALSKLIDRKPGLVMQIQKSGSTMQARKRYRLTAAGVDEVHRMLGDQIAES